MRHAIARAREMRKSLSAPEARLWVALRRLRADGHHFRRQAPFRGYFLDFVCFAPRLVIEVDGAQHGTADQAAHDAVRDAVLVQEGFRVLRFLASDVLANLEGVVTAIRLALPPPDPSGHPPHKGEGKKPPSPSWGGWPEGPGGVPGRDGFPAPPSPASGPRREADQRPEGPGGVRP